MTEAEREELIEKMAKAWWEFDYDDPLKWESVTEWSKENVRRYCRTALAVAEPVIREQEDDALLEENARLRSILATKMRPPFDDDLAGEPYAAEDRQPEPGGLGRVGQVEGGRDDGGA
jgi:hypothetical protein